MWPFVGVIVICGVIWAEGNALNHTQFVDETHLFTHFWSQVVRGLNHSDLIVPSLCKAPCDRLFHALRHGNVSDCLCRCPEEMPIFLQTLGQCIQRIEACPRTVKFNDGHIPVIELPKKSHKIEFWRKILWKESGIKVRPHTGARCNVSSVEYLGRDQSWIQLDSNIIYAGWDKEAVFRWNGTIADSIQLSGTIILVTLNCFGNLKSSHCLTFRVTGALDYGDSFGKDDNGDDHVAYGVIILLVILLTFSITGGVALWNICWKMKKNELITGLQLQFLYRLKEEKDIAEAAQHYQALAHAAFNMGKQQDDKQSAGKTHLASKRKLFFSPEFFDEEHMKNPPLIADQFLLDLRRMIKVAKQRIHQQRYVPNLRTIPEEPPELFEPYMKVKTYFFKKDPMDKCISLDKEKNSKGIDSKHSSIDADSTKENKSPEVVNKISLLKRKKSQSRIPINKHQSKSPKLNPKFIIPSADPSNGLPPPPPPRNPPPPIPVQSRSKEEIFKSRKERKSYVIFPSELELKKSLPRRIKKLDERALTNEL